MTEETKPKTTRKKPEAAPVVAEKDLTAMAILFAAFLRKGYNQIAALQTAQQVYKELDK